MRLRKCRIFLLGAVILAIAPSAAAAHPTYMECDRASKPDYPFVLIAPMSCNLGLSLSYYDVQPIPGRRYGTVGLRRLHWYGWGHHEAFAHGLACNIYADGRTIWSQCAHVTVHVFDPVSIGPAGGAYIYQRTEVRHTRIDHWRRFTFWYRPGTDY